MRLTLAIFGLCFQMAAFAQSFDHAHNAFNKVLEKYVVVYDNNLKSAVDYKQLSQDRQRLDGYLTSLSQVEQAQYQNWTQNQQLSFLINAYNAFTLQLIIDNIAQFESGNAESIRDLGGLFTSPWERAFFTLLGKKRTLDWVEHEKIRVDFDEPRIHAALVCAAVSCPKLRAEAFTAEKLDSQLEDQMLTFLSDRDTNGVDEKGLYLSRIFDWYSEDFGNIRDYMRHYDDALANTAEEKEQLNQEISIRYVNYNWQLNSLNYR
ncbi:DUF547 domain-containing protein [Idiomarina ramblicola]|uniref:DUF547 domain-containing protein n=1 Tax=Idiomarina ramblicola TaxID=263724 RepID=A0A432YUY9_9GAMM|nr:DUF547 domain-containing protein [Idiomarina ramblicola]RUO67130.1 DUF547 domain-containing protein [Idiomarina ramblicola]